MHTDFFQRQGDIDSIIDEKLRPTRSRHGLHLTRECHKFPCREIAFTELNRRRHGIHDLLQKWDQRAPIGLMAIRDDKKTTGKLHQRSNESGVLSRMLKTVVQQGRS
jgi:hypothetical protein